MPGNLEIDRTDRGQKDTLIMNGGIHHAPVGKTTSNKPSSAANITSGSNMDDPESAADPSQIKFLPKCDGQKSKKTCFKSWNRREKIFLFFSAFLLILCIIFITVAFTRDLQLQSQLRRNKTTEVCLSKSCVSTAAQLMAGMDFTADPCHDFYQFACGQWNKKHIIPEDKPTYTTFDKLNDDLQPIMKGLLEEAKTEGESSAINKAKIFYNSCINTTQIDEMGDAPLRTLIRDLGGWPVLNNQWSSPQFVVEDVLSKMLGKYGNAFLFKSNVKVDDKNSSVNIIQIQQGELGMPSREYYLMKDHAGQMQAYSRFMKDVVNLLGAQGPEVNQQLDDILNFEIKLANLSVPHEDTTDTGALYNKMTVKELQALIPTFNLLKYLKGFLLNEITEDEPVVVFASLYVQNIANLIHNTDKRTLANYLMWRLMIYMVPELSEPYQQVEARYNYVMQGMQREAVRWKKCVKFVNDRMGLAVGAMFIKDNFKKESKETALEMIHNIREAFNELLEENDWMDDQTRSFAKDKANAMIERIGYPDFITDAVQLDAKYDTLEFREDRYFNNYLSYLEFASRKMMETLRQPVPEDDFEQAPVVVNAFYNPNTNNILLPAGILQPLFYSAVFPKSLNYGGIGVVIGHEITHGFDDKGRQYDKHGNIKQWWDDHTIQAFQERAQCIIDQYSQYKLEQIDEYMNGKMTQGENIADNGGLKQAYRAYRKWVLKNGEEPPLPGIELSHNQLFFLNYAQIWCGKMRDEEAWRKIRTSSHSLGPLRVFGPLSNSKEFAQAYSCPLGSRMNPKSKCSFW